MSRLITPPSGGVVLALTAGRALVSIHVSTGACLASFHSSKTSVLHWHPVPAPSHLMTARIISNSSMTLKRASSEDDGCLDKGFI